MRFNNNPEALIFGSFDQAKEQRTDFKINHLKNTTNLFHLQIFSPNSEWPLALGLLDFVNELKC